MWRAAGMRTWRCWPASLAGKLAGQAPPPFWTTLAQAEQDYEQRL
ncbi:putative toxin-antitoxin system, toxin component [Bordetella pertussis STO1-CHOC-0017]|nr:putative toxin-antitoxin system, toxin component [Bordetella pertussis STO1-CHOC-0017]